MAGDMNEIQERLEEMKARCEAATPGPWTTTYGGVGYGVVAPEDPRSVPQEETTWRPDGLIVVAKLDGSIGEHGEESDNGDFIAHARTDIPWLREQVERLQATVDALKLELSMTPEEIKSTLRGGRMLDVETDMSKPPTPTERVPACYCYTCRVEQALILRGCLSRLIFEADSPSGVTEEAWHFGKAAIQRYDVYRKAAGDKAG